MHKLAKGGLPDDDLDAASNGKAFNSDQESAAQDFYEDIFEELAKHGVIENLNVCDNLADHMVGSVYVKFLDEDAAAKAMQSLQVSHCRYDAISDSPQKILPLPAYLSLGGATWCTSSSWTKTLLPRPCSPCRYSPAPLLVAHLYLGHAAVGAHEDSHALTVVPELHKMSLSKPRPRGPC